MIPAPGSPMKAPHTAPTFGSSRNVRDASSSQRADRAESASIVSTRSSALSVGKTYASAWFSAPAFRAALRIVIITLTPSASAIWAVSSVQLSHMTVIDETGIVCWRRDRIVRPMVAASLCAGISTVIRGGPESRTADGDRRFALRAWLSGSWTIPRSASRVGCRAWADPLSAGNPFGSVCGDVIADLRRWSLVPGTRATRSLQFVTFQSLCVQPCRPLRRCSSRLVVEATEPKVLSHLDQLVIYLSRFVRTCVLRYAPATCADHQPAGRDLAQGGRDAIRTG